MSAGQKLKAETLKAEIPAGAVCLTKGQMAAALQISVRSLNGMMARGEVDYYRIGERLVRFRIEDALKRMDETVLVREEFTEDNEGNEGGAGE